MTRAERTVNLIGVVVPFLGLIAAVVLLWNQWVDWIDLTIMAVTYVLFGLGRHGRLPPAAHPPQLPDAQGDRVHVRRARLDGRSRAR